jgi:Skp family chaperone for outer membrane proteins
MKKFYLVLILLVYPILSFADDGIYFVDADIVLNNSNYGKKIVNKLKEINSNNILNIEKDEEELKKIENEINKIKNIISEDELKKKISNLKNKIKIYREKKDIKFKEYNDLKNRELKQFFVKITPLIEEFMEINSIKIILEKKNIFIANSKYDKTDALIEFLNKNIKND